MIYHIDTAEVFCIHEDSSTPSRSQSLFVTSSNIGTIIICLNTSELGGSLKSVLPLGLVLDVPYSDCERSLYWSLVINLLWELSLEAQI